MSSPRKLVAANPTPLPNDPTLVTWSVWVLFCALMVHEPEQQLKAPSTISSLKQPHRSRVISTFESQILEGLEYLFGAKHGFSLSEACRKFFPLSVRFRECVERDEIYTVGRVHEFERKFAKLTVQQIHGFDTPLYGIIMLQGFQGFTVRYPEYHLARDICELHRTLREEGAQIEELRRHRSQVNTEVHQAFARATIVACYNLLEAVTNGLAAEWLLKNAKTPNPALDQLIGFSGGSLRKRFLAMPSAVLLDASVRFESDCEPFKSLFGRLKRRRDYIVHTAPESEGSVKSPGLAKEDRMFHDIPLADVEETIETTFSAIRAIWPTVRGKVAPSWLPVRDPDGLYRYKRIRAA